MPLQLLVDTNLFFECKKLESLPWDELGSDEIKLLITKPVLDEIDKHKKRGGRTRTRALEVFKRVRDMIQDDLDEIVIQSANPKVVFCLAANLPFDEELNVQLDQNKPDDRLVGILSAIQKREPKTPACLFTHDAGPASSARSLNLPFRLIQDHWLRPAQESADSKRIKELENELTNYRSQEPIISIDLENYDQEANQIKLVRQHMLPLTEAELIELVNDIENQFPKIVDFNSSSETDPSTIRLGNSVASKEREFLPPTDEEIAHYHNSLYPDWLNVCRETLATLHTTLTPPKKRMSLLFSMQNRGARPANKVRVSFRAEGDIYIYRFNSDDKAAYGTDNKTPETPQLPPPPSPPKGKVIIKTKDTRASAMHTLERNRARDLLGAGHAAQRLFRDQEGIRGILRQHSSIADLISGSSSLSPMHESFHTIHPINLPKHDPEKFYFDSWPSSVPVDAGALTCDLWRHRSSTEHFEIEVEFGKDAPMSGSIVCEVHSENLTQPAQKRLRVELVIENASVYDTARGMIELISVQ